MKTSCFIGTSALAGFARLHARPYPRHAWLLAALIALLSFIPLTTPLPAVAQVASDFTYGAIIGRCNGVLLSGYSITGYRGPGGAVTIPATFNGEPILAIGNSAFQNKTTLISVIIPGCVSSIGEEAFASCSSLTNVTIPSSVTSIGYRAFADCSSLTSVTIPGSIKDVGQGAFQACATLTEINVDATNSFYASLDGVLFDKNLTTLIQYPGGKGGSYTIGGAVTNILGGAFAGCIGLTGVTIPGNMTAIPDFVFSGCMALTNVTILNGIVGIGNSAFASCTSLSSITIPSTVTYIGNACFSDCSGLASLTIPNGLTSIGAVAFENSGSLVGMTIPGSVTNIGIHAFYGCMGLTGITVDTANATYSSLDGVLYDKSRIALIQYPGGKAGSYTVPVGVTSIREDAFANCMSLTSTTIPDSVTDIGDEAFDSCTNLASISIPGSIASIGNNAFSWCVSLASVTIPSGVASVGSGAFESCLGLTNVAIPASVTNIGPWAFYNCTGLLTIIVDPASAAYSSLDGVLFDKSQATLINYPAGKAGTYALPNAVTSIWEYAFANCAGLTGVTIPGGVTTIGQYAFVFCTSLQGVFFKGNAPIFGSSAFDYTSATVYYLPGTTGWNGTFVGRPTRLWDPLMQTSGVGPAGFGFNIAGTADIPIVIEAATNPASANWAPLQSLNLTNGAFYFSDPNWTNYPARNYRIRSP